MYQHQRMDYQNTDYYKMCVL